MEILDIEPDGNPAQKSTRVDSIITDSFLPLLHYIPKTRENHFFYKNGLSKLIPRLDVKVHSDLEECYELWNKFTPNTSLFDVWDFRLAWYQGYQHMPYFYTLYERQKPVAVLPLWFNGEKKLYQWFGSDWMEGNTFFAKDEKLVDLLFEIAPNPLHLNAMYVESDWSEKKVYSSLKPDEDPKNLKEISTFSSIDQLLHTFDKKYRYNLKSDYYNILDMNPKVIVTEEKSLDKLSTMISMNIERFSKDPTDESDLIDIERRRTYEQMVANSGAYGVKFIEVYIQNHLAASDFIITYKDTYYTMKGGNDVNRFKGIGNFMVYFEFEDAMRNGFSVVDCLQMDNGWKHRYFDQKELFILEK